MHGFGFSFALKQTLQFAGSHLVTSLLSFNVGVELGQLLVLVLLIPALSLLFRYALEERLGVIIASALVVHTAWHWMIDRGAALLQYDLSFSDPATLARALRALMVIVADRWRRMDRYERSESARHVSTHTENTEEPRRTQSGFWFCPN